MIDKVISLDSFQTKFEDFFLETNTSILIRLSGRSMLPLLKTDDVVRLSFLDESKINLGDILIYKETKNSRLVCHRVYGFDNNFYILAGDWQWGSRYVERILKEQIIGRVTHVKHRDMQVPINSIRYYLKSFLIFCVRFCFIRIGLFIGTVRYCK